MDRSALAGFFDELGKIAEAGDAAIDDLYASPPEAVMPYLRRAHGLGKRSSWTDIGPVGQAQGTPAQYQRVPWSKEKKAEDGDHGIQDRYDFQGLPISVENVAGTTREGTDKDGHHWETKMKHDYGFIDGTKAGDGDAVDVYVGPEEDAPAAYVVHQHKDNGKGFDEDKVMLGFRTKKEAREAYLKHYDDPKYLGPIDKVSVERLRELVQSKKRLAKITG